MSRCHYDVLGVRRNADENEIRRAYKQAALRHHPDRGGRAKDFEAINEAFSVLGDADRRRQYDLQQPGASGVGSSGRREVHGSLPCTLRELGGWDPVPLMLAMASAGLPMRLDPYRPDAA